jgi:hypothetical protein
VIKLGEERSLDSLNFRTDYNVTYLLG